ncbi:MAG: fumarylacetoacetate hydrolase family protein [Proteobacteria bacterium]|nr:fumarylacetoacetate hydrolase family protein [Pseudomonadota bacterium]
MTNRIETIARRLADARRAGSRIALDDAPRDFEEAFAVQERIVAMLAEPVVGWKGNEMPNGLVIFAPLLASGMVPAGGTWSTAGGEPAGIELEIAFRLGADVPVGASHAQIFDAVASAHVIFELCQSRLRDPDTVPRHLALADFISNTGFVVGSQFKGWREKDLRAIAGRLFVDGRLHIEGKTADPMRALQVLAPALASRGKALKAGHVVITGSLIGMNWLSGKHAIQGEIDGCGTVQANVEAT